MAGRNRLRQHRLCVRENGTKFNVVELTDDDTEAGAVIQYGSYVPSALRNYGTTCTLKRAIFQPVRDL